MDHGGKHREETLIMRLYDLPNPHFILSAGSRLSHFGSVPQREGDAVVIVIVDEHRGNLEGPSFEKEGHGLVVADGRIFIDDAPDSNRVL